MIETSQPVRECFICLSGEEPPALVQSPCNCRGSLGLCHAECLVQARRALPRPECPTCHGPYPPEAHPLAGDIETLVPERSRQIFMYLTVGWSCLCAVASFWAGYIASGSNTKKAAIAALVAAVAVLANACIAYQIARCRRRGLDVNPDNTPRP
jgi:hypothetical protein